MKSSSAGTKVSFKQQMLQAREQAIVQTVNRLLAEKGFDAMTVDEVAASVGIAKASLYKHFPSKEDLAAAAMVGVMRRAQDFIASLPADGRPLDQLKAVASIEAWPCPRCGWTARCHRCPARTPHCAQRSSPASPI